MGGAIKNYGTAKTTRESREITATIAGCTEAEVKREIAFKKNHDLTVIDYRNRC